MTAKTMWRRGLAAAAMVAVLASGTAAASAFEPGTPGFFTATTTDAEATLATVQVNVDVARLVDGQPLASAAYRVTAYPLASINDQGIVVGGGDLVTSGTLTAAGTVSLQVPQSAEGQYFVFSLPDVGARAVWPFQVTSTGPLDLHDLVDAFHTAHPDGDVTITYRPTPGPSGAQGPQGAYDVEVYAVAADRPDAPTGGIVRVATAEIVTLPTGTPSPARGPPDVPDGDKLWISRALINPATASAATVTPVWLPYAEAGGTGPSGPQGTRGWAPLFGRLIHGDASLLRLAGWSGGTGDPPGGVGLYIAQQGVSGVTVNGVFYAGLTDQIDDAADFRGAQGAQGHPGPIGPGNRTYTGAADPTLGTDPTLAAAPIGSLYFRNRPLVVEVWEKTTTTEWTRRSEHDLDAGQLIPAGGEVGQVIAKTGTGDYNRGWIDQTGGGGGPTYSAGAGIDISGTVISIDDLGVTSAKLGAGSVSAPKIGAGAVTGPKIGASAVAEDNLAAAVRTKLNAGPGDDSVGADQLNPNTNGMPGDFLSRAAAGAGITWTSLNTVLDSQVAGTRTDGQIIESHAASPQGVRWADNTGGGGTTYTAVVPIEIDGTVIGVVVPFVLTGDGGQVLTVDGTDSGNSTIMAIATPDTGQQKAFGAQRDSQTWDWAQFAGNLPGPDKPGFAMGPGDAARDTNLYRDGENHLRTDDTFQAASLIVDGAGVLATAPTMDSHIANKAYVDANTGGVSAYGDLTGVPIIIDDTPEPTSAHAGLLFWQPTSKRLSRVVGHRTVPQAVTWTALAANYAFGDGRTYAGARQSRTAAPQMISATDVWYLRDVHHFITGDANQRAVYYAPPQGFLGLFSTTGEATQAVTAVLQIAAYPASDTNPTVFPYQATAVTPQEPEEWHLETVGDPAAIGRALVHVAISDNELTFQSNDGTEQAVILPAGMGGTPPDDSVGADQLNPNTDGGAGDFLFRTTVGSGITWASLNAVLSALVAGTRTDGQIIESHAASPQGVRWASKASADALPDATDLPNQTLYGLTDRLFVWDAGDTEWRNATLDSFRDWTIGGLRTVIDIESTVPRDGDQVILMTQSGNRYQTFPVFASRVANETILETAHEGNTDRWAKGKLPTDVVYTEDLPDPPSPAGVEVLWDNLTTGDAQTIDVEGGFGDSDAFVAALSRAIVAADDGKELRFYGTYTAGPTSNRVSQWISETIPAVLWRTIDQVTTTQTTSANTRSLYAQRFDAAGRTGWAEGRFMIGRHVTFQGVEQMRIAAAANNAPDITDFRLRIEIE